MPDKDASARQDSSPSESSLPFFTRFLEGQDSAERSSTAHNDSLRTLKYPSDRDEIDFN